MPLLTGLVPRGPDSWGTGVVIDVPLGIGVLALILFLALRNNSPTGASTTMSAPVATSSPTPAPWRARVGDEAAV